MPFESFENVSDAQGRAIRSFEQELTRAANVTPYAANTIVGSIVAFTLANVFGGGGIITKVLVKADHAAMAGVSLVLDVFAASPTVIADGGAAVASYANKWIGEIALDQLATGEGASDVARSATLTNFTFSCAADSRQLFFRLRTKTGFTPKSAGKITLSIDSTITG